MYVVSEGANTPTVPEGIDLFFENKLLYGPGKAANTGGALVSGLEMTQNSMWLSWTREEVDNRLQMITKSIHKTCLEAAEHYATPRNYMNGAHIAGFVKVVDAILDLGVVKKNSDLIIVGKAIQGPHPPAENRCILYVHQRLDNGRYFFFIITKLLTRPITDTC